MGFVSAKWLFAIMHIQLRVEKKGSELRPGTRNSLQYEDLPTRNLENERLVTLIPIFFSWIWKLLR